MNSMHHNMILTWFSNKYRCRAFDYSSLRYRTLIEVLVLSSAAAGFCGCHTGFEVSGSVSENSVFLNFLVVLGRQGRVLKVVRFLV